MPEAVPLHLMARHVVVHMVKNIRTWLRLVLVVFVWLGCLPYTIRLVWRLLFWFSDGSWPITLTAPVTHASNTAKEEIAELTRQMVLQEAARATATSPVTPLLAVQETPANLVSMVLRMAKIFTLTNDTHGVTGLDSIENAASKFISSSADKGHYIGFNITTSSSAPTLLSEVKLLKHLTRYDFVNQAIITVVEGYLITFFVVVCFILIFLIREWVVQQQPGINVGAGFNADFAPVDRPRDQQPRNNANNGRNPARRGEDRLRRRRLRRRDGEVPRGGEDRDHVAADDLNNRPQAVRDALSPAAEIHRMLAEEPPRLTEEFVAIWRRARGDPQEVLRILETEDIDGQMKYWVNLQRRRMLDALDDSSVPVTPSDRPSRMVKYRSPDMGDDIKHQSALDDEDVPDNWYDIPEAGDDYERALEYDTRHDESSNNDKGKGRAGEEHHNPSIPTIFSSSSGSRPRALSDGPHRSFSKASLGHGTWTFNNLPDTAHSMELRLPTDHQSNFAGVIPGSTSPMLDLDHSYEHAALGRHNASQAASSSWEEDLSPENLGSVSSTQAPAGQEVEQDMSVWDNTSESTIDETDQTHRLEVEETEGSVAGTEDSERALHDAELPLLDNTAPVAEVNVPPRGVFGLVTDFFWGGVGPDAPPPPLGQNDAHIVQDVAAEPPFVPVAHGDAAAGVEAVAEAQDIAEALAPLRANADEMDALALEEAEDFDGILDLIGMRGPIFSLVQNAVFSAFLLSLTVAFGIWIPYNIGKLSLLLIANPGPTFKLPLRFIFGGAAYIQDVAMCILGSILYAGLNLAAIPLYLLAFISPSLVSRIASVTGDIGDVVMNVASAAFERVASGTLDVLINVGESDMFAFSAASHESLLYLENLVLSILTILSTGMSAIAKQNSESVMAYLSQAIVAGAHSTQVYLLALPSTLVKPETWVISLELTPREVPLDLAMSVWSGTDRFFAIITGYLTVCFLGALYVQKGTPFSSSQVGREWEATIIDLLNQAGGVFKVILIISIEMLVFPLYCGLLLDLALLPLFEGATISSRLLFTVRSPLTSVFVHWFVGTCYMFHFALFVSMCRKIMRKGVLCKLGFFLIFTLFADKLHADFIRDPDDPTFHPVRDVLERNVITQLRKILFSALVYGALVIVCLGGVVWGLAYGLKNVLPIHWSSNEAVFEFPIDLLFYNFLMPLAVKLFKPSEALHTMYTWWFRKCARLLRLTWFMFDERRKDEEGYYRHWNWSNILPGRAVATGDNQVADNGEAVETDILSSPDFQRDGRYVRTPASDQVRIPKGYMIFLTVDENNRRVDGLPEPGADEDHGRGNLHYKHLYVPPWFRVRIFSFIVSIWLFAAFTGVSVTIIPLVLGRFIFAKFIPPHVRKNDIYALSIGVYILGSLLYAAYHVKSFFQFVKNGMSSAAARPASVIRRLLPVVLRVMGIAWTYTAFLVVLPMLFSVVVEFYFIVPLHSYMAVQERHVIHFVQNWTLGLLYVKLTTRFILWHSNSRQAISLRAITRNGYLNPDARLATRCFILPLGLVLTAALTIPYYLSNLCLATIFKERPEINVLVHRYTYPLTLCAVVVLFALYSLWGMVKQWQLAIRDEVYLIGERLHNYGERKSSMAGLQGGPNLRRVETGA